MVLKFNPLSHDDYIERAQQVEVGIASAGKDAIDLVSPRVFGTHGYDKDADRPMSTYHRRGYFNLVAPVLSPVLAGNNGSVLATILGMKAKEVEQILKFEVVCCVVCVSVLR